LARKLKIKRYHDGGGLYRARPHPVAVVLTIVAVGLLVFLGVSIYEPVAAFFQELASPTEPVIDLPPPPTVATEPPTEPETEPEPVAAAYPDTRAVYLPPAVLADSVLLDAALENVRESDVNAILIDIKDANGSVLYNTANPQAAEWGAVVANPLDLAAFAERLQEEELMLAVRIHVFQDSIAAAGNRENAIRYRQPGGPETEWLWLDAAESDGGRPWLNPYSEGAKQYITSLCLEAADAGAGLVMLDSFQFPLGSVNNANFGSRAGVVSRQDMLKSYQEELTAKLEEKETRTAIYLPALTLTQEMENESRYGGNPLYSAGGNIVLGALPYSFPLGFAYNDETFTQPFENPGEAAGLALSIALDAENFSEEPPAFIPLLQGGSEPGQNSVVYTADAIHSQIEAAKSRGIEEYILFATDGDYTLLF
jgi:hypothetical protein